MLLTYSDGDQQPFVEQKIKWYVASYKYLKYHMTEFDLNLAEVVFVAYLPMSCLQRMPYRHLLSEGR